MPSPNKKHNSKGLTTFPRGFGPARVALDIQSALPGPRATQPTLARLNLLRFKTGPLDTLSSYEIRLAFHRRQR